MKMGNVRGNYNQIFAVKPAMTQISYLQSGLVGI